MPTDKQKHSWYNINPFSKGKSMMRRASDATWESWPVLELAIKLFGGKKGKIVKAKEGGEIIISKNVDKDLL